MFFFFFAFCVGSLWEKTWCRLDWMMYVSFCTLRSFRTAILCSQQHQDCIVSDSFFQQMEEELFFCESPTADGQTRPTLTLIFPLFCPFCPPGISSLAWVALYLALYPCVLTSSLAWACVRLPKLWIIPSDMTASTHTSECHFQQQLSAKWCDLGFNFRVVLESCGMCVYIIACH